MDTLDRADRHFFLYAKGWYDQGDLVEDMQKIMSERCSIDPQYIRIGDILMVLVSVTCPFIKSEQQTKNFILSLAPGNFWEHSPGEAYNFGHTVIRRCLSILASTRTSRIPFELGEPDSKILDPYNKEKEI